MNLITSKTEGVMPLVADVRGKKLVLRFDYLDRRFQMPRFQIVYATSGIGSESDIPEEIIIGSHIADHRAAVFRRNQFIGMASEELTVLAMEDTTPVRDLDPNDLVYFVMALDGSATFGNTVDQAMSRLGRITSAKLRVCYQAHRDCKFNDYGYLHYPEGLPPVEVQPKKQGKQWIVR